MIKNICDIEEKLFILKIQCILNKRLYKNSYITKDLYEKVENDLLSKINHLN